MAAPVNANHHHGGTLYDNDLYSWAAEQASLLREGRFSELDLAHIAEELDGVGSEQYDKLESALTISLMHILKWDFQPARRSLGWEGAIRQQRRRIDRVIRKNPGLKPRLAEALDEAYPDGCDRASAETDLPLSTFPAECPCDWETILGRLFSVDAETTPE